MLLPLSSTDQVASASALDGRELKIASMDIRKLETLWYKMERDVHENVRTTLSKWDRYGVPLSDTLGPFIASSRTHARPPPMPKPPAPPAIPRFSQHDPSRQRPAAQILSGSPLVSEAALTSVSPSRAETRPQTDSRPNSLLSQLIDRRLRKAGAETREIVQHKLSRKAAWRAPLIGAGGAIAGASIGAVPRAIALAKKDNATATAHDALAKAQQALDRTDANGTRPAS